jgi:hypothetical protein
VYKGSLILIMVKGFRRYSRLNEAWDINKKHEVWKPGLISNLGEYFH